MDFYSFSIKDLSLPLGVLFLDSNTQVSREILSNDAPCLKLKVSSSCSIETKRAFHERVYLLSFKSEEKLEKFVSGVRVATLTNEHIYSQDSNGSEPETHQLALKKLNSSSDTLYEGSEKSFKADDDSFSREQNTRCNTPQAQRSSPSVISLTSSAKIASGRSFFSPAYESLVNETISRSILSPIYMDTVRQIDQFISIVESRVDDLSGVNFTDSMTAVVRMVRQILFFADGNYAKMIKSNEFSSLITRQMSIIIDRSRKVGSLTKKLSETTNVNGFLVELLKYLGLLKHDLTTFILLSNNLAEIDELIVNKKDIEAFREPSNAQLCEVFDEIANLCIRLSRNINFQHRSGYLPLKDNLVTLSNAFLDVLEVIGKRGACLTEKSSLLLLPADGSHESNTELIGIILQNLKIEAKDASIISTSRSSEMSFSKTFSTLCLLFLKLAKKLADLKDEELWRHFGEQHQKTLCLAEESSKKNEKSLNAGLDSARGKSHTDVEVETLDNTLPARSSSEPHSRKNSAILSNSGFTLAQFKEKFWKKSLEQLTGDISAEKETHMQSWIKFRSCNHEIWQKAFSIKKSPCIDRILSMGPEIISSVHSLEEEAAKLEKSASQTCPQISELRKSLRHAIFCLEMSFKSLSKLDNSQSASNSFIDELNALLRILRDIEPEFRNNLQDLPSVDAPPTPEYYHDTNDETSALEAAESEIEDILKEEEKQFIANKDVIFRAEAGSEKSTIKGGTLEKLVEKLTFYKLPSADFTSAFLLTYRSFTTPSELLRLLVQRYHIEIPKSMEDENLKSIYFWKKIIPIRLRVFNVLKMWIKNNYEELGPEDIQMLHDFMPTLRADFSKGTEEFESLLERKSKRDRELSNLPQSNGKPPLSLIPRPLGKDMNVLDIHPLELARQLTLIQWENFVSIKPQECLNQSWNRKELNHLSPNIREMIRVSNFIVNWISTEIVDNEGSKNRATYIKYFIAVGEKMKLLNNFDGLKSVVCGLQASGVRRLRKSWELIPGKQKNVMNDLENLMAEEKSFKNYRALLHTINPPCIPFLGVYLTDLTMIESGNSDFICDEKLINFHKRFLIAQVIHEIKQYQGTPYDLLKINAIYQWILNKEVMDPQLVYERSLQVEPREVSNS